MEKSFYDHLDELKNLADTLVPHTYPQVSIIDDQITNYLKRRSFFVDGYEVSVYFSRQDHGNFYVEIFNIASISGIFLPLEITQKVAMYFLGSSCLSRIEVFDTQHKIYAWQVKLDKTGKPLPVEKFSYENW